MVKYGLLCVQIIFGVFCSRYREILLLSLGRVLGELDIVGDGALGERLGSWSGSGGIDCSSCCNEAF